MPSVTLISLQHVMFPIAHLILVRLRQCYCFFHQLLRVLPISLRTIPTLDRGAFVKCNELQAYYCQHHM
jgi:hypothetical protein